MKRRHKNKKNNSHYYHHHHHHENVLTLPPLPPLPLPRPHFLLLLMTTSSKNHRHPACASDLSSCFFLLSFLFRKTGSSILSSRDPALFLVFFGSSLPSSVRISVDHLNRDFFCSSFPFPISCTTLFLFGCFVVLSHLSVSSVVVSFSQNKSFKARAAELARRVQLICDRAPRSNKRLKEEWNEIATALASSSGVSSASMLFSDAQITNFLDSIRPATLAVQRFPVVEKWLETQEASMAEEGEDAQAVERSLKAQRKRQLCDEVSVDQSCVLLSPHPLQRVTESK